MPSQQSSFIGMRTALMPHDFIAVTLACVGGEIESKIAAFMSHMYCGPSMLTPCSFTTLPSLSTIVPIAPLPITACSPVKVALVPPSPGSPPSAETTGGLDPSSPAAVASDPIALPPSSLVVVGLDPSGPVPPGPLDHALPLPPELPPQPTPATTPAIPAIRNQL